MQIALNINEKQADFFLNLLKSFKENSVIDNFEVVQEIDLTDKLKSSLEDVKLMIENKKEKVDIEDFLNGFEKAKSWRNVRKTSFLV